MEPDEVSATIIRIMKEWHETMYVCSNVISHGMCLAFCFVFENTHNLYKIALDQKAQRKSMLITESISIKFEPYLNSLIDDAKYQLKDLKRYTQMYDLISKFCNDVYEIKTCFISYNDEKEKQHENE